MVEERQRAPRVVERGQSGVVEADGPVGQAEVVSGLGPEAVRRPAARESGGDGGSSAGSCHGDGGLVSAVLPLHEMGVVVCATVGGMQAM